MNKLLNYLGYLVLITSIFLFGLLGKSVEMGISIAGCGIFLSFVNLDKFTKFKGAGFEAELKQTINEAYATIAKLKEVAIPLIETNLIILAKAGRFPDSTFSKSHDLYDQLKELQSNLSITSENLIIANKNYLNIHAWDMVNELSHEIDQSIEKGFYNKIESSWKSKL